MATVIETPLPEPALVPAHEPSERYEVIHGQKVELPPMSVLANLVASRLTAKLAVFLEHYPRGQVFPEMLFRLPLAEDIFRNRRPDVAYVSYGNWPKDRPVPEEASAWDVVPDLAVEIVSPTDFAEDVIAKMEESFRAGVRQVWLVYPRRRLLYRYESALQVKGFTRSDTLESEPLFPGLRLALPEIVPEPPAEPAAAPAP